MAERLRSASNSSLPIVSVIDDTETMKTAVALLKKATAIHVKISELEDQEREVKEQLASICTAYNLKGLRHGLNGFEYQGWMTRKTLSKERLLANGVTADQIADSFVEGTPFLMTKITPFDLE